MIKDYLNPLDWVNIFEAEEVCFSHYTGAPTSDGTGWFANVTSYNAGYLLFGPYTRDVKAGWHEAKFFLKIDNNTYNHENVVRIEVYDADYHMPYHAHGAALASKEVRRTEFPTVNEYWPFSLEFLHVGGLDRLEFRIYWYDNARITVDKIVVQ